MSVPCRANPATVNQYWENLGPGKGWRNRATGKICKNLELGPRVPGDVPGNPGNNPPAGPPTDDNPTGVGPDPKKGGSMTDPKTLAIDTTNPMVKGLLEMLVAQATGNMQNPRAGGNQFVGPTAQLFPQGLQRFNPSNVGTPNVPGVPTDPAGPITQNPPPPGTIPQPRPPYIPGPSGPDPTNPRIPDPRFGGPDPRVQPRRRGEPVQTDGRRGRQATATRNFSPTEQLLAEMGLLGEEFQPVSSGSRYLNSFQPQYINQYTGARRF